MTVVNRVALKYAVKGAKAAQRADRAVRDTVRKTGRVARRQTRDIASWLKENKKQVAAIGAAMAASVGVLLRKSPAMQVASSRIQFQFEMLAFALGQELKPAFDAVADGVETAVQWFRDAPESVQTLIAVLVGGAGLAGALATVAAGIAGVVGLLSGTVLTVIGTVVAAIAALAISWETNFLGMRDTLKDVAGTIADIMRGVWKVVKNAVQLVFNIITGDWGEAWQNAKNIVKGNLEILEGLIELLVIDPIQSAGRAVKDLGEIFVNVFDIQEEVNTMKSAIVTAINHTVIPAVNLLIDGWNNTVAKMPGVDEMEKLDKIRLKTDEAAGAADRVAQNWDEATEAIGNAVDVAAELEKGRTVGNLLDPRPDQFEPTLGPGERPGQNPIPLGRVQEAVRGLSQDEGGPFHPSHVSSANFKRITELLNLLRKGRPAEKVMEDAIGESFVGAFLSPMENLETLAQAVGVPGFRHGGVVPGQPGAPVPAVLHGGEVVLSRDQVQALSNAGTGGEPRARGGETTIINNTVEEGAVQIHAGEDTGRDAADDMIRRFRQR